MRRMFSLKQLQEIADSEVKKLVEGGTLNNAKPIYFHGLDIYSSDTRNAIQVHVLRNDNTPINSVEKFKAWAESISGEVFIQSNGGVKIGTKWLQVYLIIKRNDNTYTLCYMDPDSGYNTTPAVLEELFNSVNDAINKIN